MKIVIFLRFPKIQKANWKIKIIERLRADGHNVVLVFGESSFWRHAKFALKRFGQGFLSKKDALESEPQNKIYDTYKDSLSIYRINNLNSEYAEKILKSENLDLLLLLGSGIIRDNILRHPKKGTIHCHQGKLPSMRGVNTIQWSILLDKKVAVSVHMVDEGIDTGSILRVEEIEFSPSDSIEDIYKRCESKAAEILPEVINDFDVTFSKKRVQFAEMGDQYFMMHPFFIDIVKKKIKQIQK